MDQNRTFEAVKFFKNCLLEKKIKVSRLVLFGSRSRKAGSPESDIDLALVSEDFEGKGIFQRAKLTQDAEIRTIRKFKVPLDVIDLTPSEFENESSLAASFAHGGIEL